MRLQSGLPSEQQCATHVHMDDGCTHAEPDVEPHARAYASAHSRADTRADTRADCRTDCRADAEPDTAADAAPVRQRRAPVRHGRGRRVPQARGPCALDVDVRL